MPKYLKAYVEKVEGEDGVLSVAIATDRSVDRDGERIDPSGWDFTNFLKNAVLLWAHNYREEPLGKVMEITQDGDRILFKPKFAVDIYDKARRVFDFYKAGFLNAFSVGFIPREWKDEQAADGRRIRVYTKAELLEISCVPVPSNPNALVLARGAGMDVAWLKSYAGESGIELKEPEEEAAAPAAAAPAAAEPGTGEKPEAPGGVPGAAAEAEVAKAKEEIMKAVDEKLAGVKTELADGMKSLLDEVHQLQKSIAEIGKDGAGSAGTKVEPGSTLKDLNKEEVEHMVLSALDKTLGLRLRDLKRGKAE